MKLRFNNLQKVCLIVGLLLFILITLNFVLKGGMNNDETRCLNCWWALLGVTTTGGILLTKDVTEQFANRILLLSGIIVAVIAFVGSGMFLVSSIKMQQAVSQKSSSISEESLAELDEIIKLNSKGSETKISRPIQTVKDAAPYPDEVLFRSAKEYGIKVDRSKLSDEEKKVYDKVHSE